MVTELAHAQGSRDMRHLYCREILSHLYYPIARCVQAPLSITGLLVSPFAKLSVGNRRTQV